MLAVLNRHKVVFIIMALIILALLAWLLIGSQESDTTPSRGVFVLNRLVELDNREGGI
jgi:lipopolysaccharide export system protein LptC